MEDREQLDLDFHIRGHRVVRFHRSGEVRVTCGSRKISLDHRPRHCPVCGDRLNDADTRMAAGRKKRSEALRFMRRSEQNA